MNLWQTDSALSGLTTQVNKGANNSISVNCVTTHLSIFSVVEIDKKGNSDSSDNSTSVAISFSFDTSDGRKLV